MTSGKWIVWKSPSGAWAVYQVGNLSIGVCFFDTRAEALAYVIEQAEADR